MAELLVLEQLKELLIKQNCLTEEITKVKVELLHLEQLKELLIKQN